VRLARLTAEPLAAEYMFFAISLWVLLLFLAVAAVAGYFGGRASHSIIFGMLVGLAALIFLIAASVFVAWRRAQ
jgi:hypothetical protein